SNDLVIRDQVSWDESSGKVRATSCTFYGKIAVQELALTDPAPVLVQEALLNGICQSGLNLLPWTKKIIGFRHRTLFLKRLAEENQMFKDLPELSDDGLIKNLSDWLGPFLSGVKTASVLKQVDLDGALKSLFTWEQLQMIDRDAPTHFKVPSGSRIPIRYGDENGPFDSPVLAVRLQEMFGMTSTPAIAKGQVPLTLHLLSPASRPVQITQDLENFWARTYKEVKKDLMGRYPKHYWPDDPGSAKATNRAKPRTRS
ncbi:MAG: ATP-dependent helicase HrpB, partial [Desulfobacterales bacterium]|nr:ATP-dependent helicase HrpB [Desulfobacterales bacterium]